MMESYPLIRVVESIGNNPKVTDYEMVLNQQLETLVPKLPKHPSWRSIIPSPETLF